MSYSDGGAHCFSCGYHVFPPSGNFFRQKEEVVVDTRVLPGDFTREVDPAGWKWLSQWGLPISYWIGKVGYSPRAGRLVFPVGPKGHPVFSIGRLLREPDKLNRKWYAWGDCHSHAEILGSHGDRPCLSTVVVEDLISAHVVSQIAEALPLFGTEIHPCHIYALRDNSKRPVVLWLDNDQRGLVARKAARLSMLTGRPVSYVHTEKDPKALSVKEIKEVLNEQGS